MLPAVPGLGSTALLNRENRGDIISHGGCIGRFARRGRIVLRELGRGGRTAGGQRSARCNRQLYAVTGRVRVRRLRSKQPRASSQYRQSSGYPVAVLI